MYVPIDICECCEGSFTIFILTIIVIFIIFFGIVIPIANVCRQEDEREKAEYKKWAGVHDDYPFKSKKYRRKVIRVD